jgi:hypothetical protein
LVAITPAAGFVSQTGAFIIGAVGGVAVSRGVLIKDIFKFDDALDAFGVHAIAGLLGSLMVGLFAKEEIGGVNGAFYGHPKQLGLQVYGVVVTAGWACFGTWLVMTFVDVFIGLRVSASKEGNMDRSQHGSTMYSQISSVPDRKQKLEDEKKGQKKTIVRRFKERNQANDTALDVIEDREVRQKRIPNMIEMSEERKETNGTAKPNPQGGEELSSLEEITLDNDHKEPNGEALQKREEEGEGI